jgi:predicted nucleic acid-binding Zn ribbon protein
MNPYAPPSATSSSTESRPVTQIVGRGATCGKRLTTQAEGIGCPACSVAFHNRCLARPGHCASCGRDVASLERLASEEESRVLQSRVRRGRALMWSTAIAWVPCQLWAFSDRPSQLVPFAVSSVLTVLLFWKARSGSVGARRYLAGASLITMIVALLGMTGGISMLDKVVFGALSLTEAFGFWVFGMSRDVRAYMDACAPAHAHR